MSPTKSRIKVVTCGGCLGQFIPLEPLLFKQCCYCSRRVGDPSLGPKAKVTP